MLAILPGQPAKGERQPAATAQDYPNLTPAQRDKLLAALAQRQPPKAEPPPGCVKTEVTESCRRNSCPALIMLFGALVDTNLCLLAQAVSTYYYLCIHDKLCKVHGVGLGWLAHLV